MTIDQKPGRIPGIRQIQLNKRLMINDTLNLPLFKRAQKPFIQGISYVTSQFFRNIQKKKLLLISIGMNSFYVSGLTF